MTIQNIRRRIDDLRTAPEVLRVIRAASASYKKRSASVVATDEVELHGTYWDGGSRSTYTAVDLATMRSRGAPQYAPPQFGGPRQAPRVVIPDGVAIVETGVFCGKTASACVYVNHATFAKLLTHEKV